MERAKEGSSLDPQSTTPELKERIEMSTLGCSSFMQAFLSNIFFVLIDLICRFFYFILGRVLFFCGLYHKLNSIYE